MFRRRDWAGAADFAARHHTMWSTVHFLGVWDTVAAFRVQWTWLDVAVDRIPMFRHRFHRFNLSEVVVHGRHAVAIDEPRKSFHPELWPEPRCPGTGTRTMGQVWFAGSHSDVGGGYAERQLSDIALQWMVCEALWVEEGLRLQRGHGVVIVPDARGPLPDPRAHGLARLYRRQTRSCPVLAKLPTIHQSVLDRVCRRLFETAVFWLYSRFAKNHLHARSAFCSWPLPSEVG